MKGNTTMERRGGKGVGVVSPLRATEPTGSITTVWASCTAPTKRKPLRASVLIRRCFSPLSPMAVRAAFRRVVSAASETMRPFHTALMRSSLVTTRSLLRIRHSSRSNTCGVMDSTSTPRRVRVGRCQMCIPRKDSAICHSFSGSPLKPQERKE